MEITTIGLDLAKSVFQVHAVDAAVAKLSSASAAAGAGAAVLCEAAVRASSAWKLAARAIIGRASSIALGTRCG